jgi:hypothetical protein
MIFRKKYKLGETEQETLMNASTPSTQTLPGIELPLPASECDTSYETKIKCMISNEDFRQPP